MIFITHVSKKHFDKVVFLGNDFDFKFKEYKNEPDRIDLLVSDEFTATVICTFLINLNVPFVRS